MATNGYSWWFWRLVVEPILKLLSDDYMGIFLEKQTTNYPLVDMMLWKGLAIEASYGLNVEFQIRRFLTVDEFPRKKW